MISVLMWWHVWVTGHPTSTITCNCGDPAEEVWYLAWTPWAITHLHNPFLSNAIFAGQGGANMLVNTSSMAFAVLLAPVTWLFGPIASFNVAVTLAPVLSGWCMFLALRKVTRFVPAQVIAAALYAFSPSIVTNEPIGHFFLLWAFFPPLAFLCLHDLFVTRRHRPVVSGGGLGVLTVAQFFTGTELLAMCIVVGAVGVVCCALVAPRRAWKLRRHVAVGFASAAVVVGVLLAYPLWFTFAGPRRVVGLAWPGTPGLGAPPSAIVSAGPGVGHSTALVQLSGYYGAAGPVMTFLGIGVLLFIAVSAFRWVRNRLAVVMLVTGVAAWSLSLGPRLLPRSASTAWVWLPFHAIWHIPPFGQIIPVRFSALTVFAAAMLLAISADSWWRLACARLERTFPRPRRLHARLSRKTIAVGAVLTGVTAATLVPVAMTYSLPFTVHASPTPEWFTTAADRLAPGTVVLTYPYPSPGLSQAMGWEAEDGLRFRLVGGYAIVPGADGLHSSAVSPFKGTEAVLDDLSLGLGDPLPQPEPSILAMVRSTLVRRGVDVVVVSRLGRDPVYAAGFFTAVLGRLPRYEDGSWVWYGLGSRAPLHLPSNALTSCTADSPSLSVPDCVLRNTAGST